MRTVLRYENGRAIWSDNIPASTGSSRLGGQLVVGGPGSVEMGRIQARIVRARMERAGEIAARGEPTLDPRCALNGRCHHRPCTSARAIRARELYATTQMTLAEIGAELGGRDHSTVIYLLRSAVV
jgi:hypothetical protein